jgi:heme exporter protein B
MVDAVLSDTRATRPEQPGWLRQVLVVYRKDLAIEAATGEVTVTSGFFALLVVVLASLSFFGGPMSARSVAAGTVWLSLAFAAVLSLGKSWQRERDEAALDGLLVSPLSRRSACGRSCWRCWWWCCPCRWSCSRSRRP